MFQTEINFKAAIKSTIITMIILISTLFLIQELTFKKEKRKIQKKEMIKEKGKKTLKEEKVMLIINTNQKNSKIQILNIKEKYQSGMKLKKGKYHIKITKRGYKTFDKWININKNRRYKIKLTKIK